MLAMGRESASRTCIVVPNQRTSILEEVVSCSDLRVSIYAVSQGFNLVVPWDPMSPSAYLGISNAYKHEICPRLSSQAQEQHKDLQALEEPEAP